MVIMKYRVVLISDNFEALVVSWRSSSFVHKILSRQTKMSEMSKVSSTMDLILSLENLKDKLHERRTRYAAYVRNEVRK